MTAGRRIVLATFGSFGDINPYLGLAIALRNRGHRPLLATLPFYREVVEREGIGFHAVRPAGDGSDRDLFAKAMHPRRGSVFIIREIVMKHFRDTYADLEAAAEGADLLVSHPLTLAVPLIAERRALPWVSCVLAPLSFFSRFDLPVLTAWPSPRPLQRIPGAARAFVGLARYASRRWVRDVDRLRTELGLPPGGNPVFEGQHSPHLVLALFSRLLAQPQPDWPARAQVAGPVWYSGATAPHLDDELERFLAAGPPPVVFTLGTSAVSAPGAFYRESVEAAVRAGVRAVLLIGRHADNRPPGRLPDSIAVMDAAPHAALMPRAAAIVHQGGAGTLHQALRAGKPMLVVPHAHDQADNAWRAERLGVGRTLTPRRYRATRVARTLQDLLGDPRYGQRAAAAAAEVAREDGAAAASDAIELLLARV